MGWGGGDLGAGGPVLGAGAGVGPAPLPLASELPRLARASLAAWMPSGVNAVLCLGALRIGPVRPPAAYSSASGVDGVQSSRSW